MKTKLLRIHSILALFLLIFTASTLLSNGSIFNIQNIANNPNYSANFTIDNIEIDGNVELDDFCAENGTGDGLSWFTAYKIENFSIDANRTGTGFVLRNTDKYVILRNLTIINSGQIVNDFDAGIKIENCSNVLLMNCSVSSNFYGFAIKDSQNIEISDNFAGVNNTVGLYLHNSDSNEISDNLILNNSLHGVYLYNSDLNNVSLNQILNNSITPVRYVNNTGGVEYLSNNGTGVFISNSINNTITNNEIRNNPFGVYLKFSTQNSIINNVISESSQHCINIYESANNIITGNGDCDINVVPIVPIIPGYSTVFIILVSVPVVLILLIKVKKKLVK